MGNIGDDGSLSIKLKVGQYPRDRATMLKGDNGHCRL
jgi:hypothetical protein